jgi:ATP-dependent Clp protease protease subunit
VKFTATKEETENEAQENAIGEMDLELLSALAPEPEEELRAMTIVGEITEELSKDVLASLWHLRHTAKIQKPKQNPEDPAIEELTQPFEIIISTPGGSADDMFAIYDAIRAIREEVEIETYGLGKVMSAGTLLLASGTKGKRKIGKYCRVMIHSVIGGHVGPLHQVENEMKEVHAIQDAYLEAIASETNLTVKELKRMLRRKENIYMNAEQAVAHGFADIIV